MGKNLEGFLFKIIPTKTLLPSAARPINASNVSPRMYIYRYIGIYICGLVTFWAPGASMGTS